MLLELIEKLKTVTTDLETAANEFTDAGEKKAYKQYQAVRQSGQTLKKIGQALRVEISKLQKVKSVKKAV